MPEPAGASGAALDSRYYENATPCAHCGAPVRVRNLALGPQVEHYDPDASFSDSTWRHCRVTVATLPAPDAVGGKR